MGARERENVEETEREREGLCVWESACSSLHADPKAAKNLRTCPRGLNLSNGDDHPLIAVIVVVPQCHAQSRPVSPY